MGSSFDLDFVRSHWGTDEASAMQSMANEVGCYRIYKIGGEQGWNNYKPIHNSAEEKNVLASPYVSYAVLVYDRGKVVNIDGLWEKSPLRKKGGCALRVLLVFLVIVLLIAGIAVGLLSLFSTPV